MKGLKDAALYPIPEPSFIRDSINALFVTIRIDQLSSRRYVGIYPRSPNTVTPRLT